MTTAPRFKTSLLIAAAFAGSTAFAATMSKPDYQAAKTQIGAEYKVDQSACDKLADNAKDVCREQAKGKNKVAKAELEFNYSGTARDANKLAMTKADAAYAVAKEMCDDKAGNAKDVCVQEAKAAHVKALADAKMNKEIHAARKDAAEDTNDAQYKVATEKCESLAGAPKAACITDAKSRFGKS